MLRDPATGRFRMWQSVPEGAGHTRLGYIESEDGLHWIRPHRVLEDPARITFGCSIFDEGPSFPDRDRRCKLCWWNDGSLQVAASPDGFVWKPLAPGVVLQITHGITHIFRDPIRKRYLALVSMYTSGPTWTGQRRVPTQSVSDDVIHWKEPSWIITRDDEDEGETQFYGLGDVVARGDLLIGMLKVLRDDLPAEPGGPVAGLGYTVLGWSRDREHWERDRQSFLNRNSQPGTWDRAMTWIGSQVIVGDETFLYYGGYARGHKLERFTGRQTGLPHMPRDRYVSRDAGGARGYLRTPLATFTARGMIVNAEVDGELRVRVLDAAGKSVPGLDWRNCAPIRGDWVAHPVQWEGNLGVLRGKPVQVEFGLRKAKLYGFEFVQ